MNTFQNTVNRLISNDNLSLIKATDTSCICEETAELTIGTLPMHISGGGGKSIFQNWIEWQGLGSGYMTRRYNLTFKLFYIGEVYKLSVKEDKNNVFIEIFEDEYIYTLSHATELVKEYLSDLIN